MQHPEQDSTRWCIGLTFLSTGTFTVVKACKCGAGGLFMPSIMVGSSFGAACGLGLMGALPAWNIQPGLYAMCAAAAMLGGVFRASISLVVIVVEGTQVAHRQVSGFAGFQGLRFRVCSRTLMGGPWEGGRRGWVSCWVTAVGICLRSLGYQQPGLHDPAGMTLGLRGLMCSSACMRMVGWMSGVPATPVLSSCVSLKRASDNWIMGGLQGATRTGNTRIVLARFARRVLSSCWASSSR